jgi:uncharacterized membrane protein YecN with MAPEG domain
MLTVTALYAGILGLMAIVLGAFPGLMRGSLKISAGDGGNPDLMLAMRRHANFVECVPLALILIGLLEFNGAPKMAIHGFGAALVVFRICHAVGLKKDKMDVPARMIGAGGSALLIAAASVWLIVKFFA